MKPAKRGALSILVLEDDPIDFRAFSRQLRACSPHKHVAEHVLDLATAVQRLQDSSYDLVVADLHLPDAAGEEVVRTLRRSCRKTPLILLTGTDDEAFARECLRAGAQDYLVKACYDERQLALLMALAMERHAVATLAEERERYERELRDTLISHVSHELRTPLAAIVQYASILEAEILGPVADSQREAFAVIQRNAASLKDMVEAMVESSRASAGKLRLRPQPYAPAAIAKEVVADLALPAMQSGVRLDLRLRRAPASALLDPEPIRQVLRNLINNAVRHGGSGKRVRLVLTSGSSPAAWELRVVDRGPGIAPAARRKLCERFYQGPSEDDAARKGLGLGLHIAQEIVAAHGGTLEVRSKVGLGTIVAVTLPHGEGPARALLAAEA